MNILLVEDEPHLRHLIRDYLVGEGYVVTVASSLREGSQKAHDEDYDCLVIDLTLPDGNGLDLVRESRRQVSPPGVIIVTAKASMGDKLTGLDLGADDYLTKPFHLPELNARLRSVLRRRVLGGHTELVAGVLTIYPDQQRVAVSGRTVELTAKEYALLFYLATNPNRLLSKAALAEHVWGGAADLANSYEFIYSHVKNLRKKLLAEGCPDYIRTRYGVGYVFSVDR